MLGVFTHPLELLPDIYNMCPKILCAPPGSVATAEDPAAIATIQSAATFSDQPIKYVFKTEGTGGQVRTPSEAVYHSQIEWYMTCLYPR